jgi:hypothetical protein
VKPCAPRAVHSREKKKRRRWRAIVVGKNLFCGTKIRKNCGLGDKMQKIKEEFGENVRRSYKN